MFPDSALKEIDFDTASDSTASLYDVVPPSSATSPHRFFPPGVAAVDSSSSSFKDSLSGEASTPSESDVDATAVELSPAGSVGRFAGQRHTKSRSPRKPRQVPPSRPPPPSGLSYGGVDIYSSPPPGLHQISAHSRVARPPPGLERATDAPPSAGMPAMARPPPGLKRATDAPPSVGMPAPPSELPPLSLLSEPVVPEVPAWAAAGTSKLASEPFLIEPLTRDANVSLMGSVTNGQPQNPGCEAVHAFTNPVPGWSTCVARDEQNPSDVSLKIADFAKHHVRENSPDRKRNLRVNGGLQSGNIQGCWQQVPQIPQVDNFNGREQNDFCQLAGGSGTPMWNGGEFFLQEPHSSHNANLSQPPNSKGTLCLAQQVSSAYNSDMHQELNFHHSLGHPQEPYMADAFGHHRHHVDHQEFTEFRGDWIQNCGQMDPWNMQTSSRQDSSWEPAFFAPGANMYY